ncbi:MAG TPA: hypothetical protein VER98_00145 [Terriglobia bacterium]|nr:hypothetical protein [Terriglobia bacterium]
MPDDDSQDRHPAFFYSHVAAQPLSAVVRLILHPSQFGFCLCTFRFVSKELQCGLPDVLMHLGSIHARRVDTGVGIIVSSHLIALIVEDLVANWTGQHVELGMRDIFRGKLSVFLRWRRGVTGAFKA